MRSGWKYLLLSAFMLTILSCQKEEVSVFKTTPYDFPLISNFRPIPQHPDNPVTVEGVELGRKLFFDPILSSDFTISCASCHLPEAGFSDNRPVSRGVNNTPGVRNSMALANLAWYGSFFWDGRAGSLHEQALQPVENPVEMNLTWDEAEQRLQGHPEYPALFEKAFGTAVVTRDLATKAIAQFEMTLLSYNSPFDKWVRGEGSLSESALRGEAIFNSEKGDCFHCHSTPELMVHPTKIFSNNGMDEISLPIEFADAGRGEVTGLNADFGKFKIPTLRNLAFTAPYMHDGRFGTLEEVIESYNLGPRISPSLDPIMIAEANRRLQETGHWGLNLSEQDKEDLKNFLLSMTDSSILEFGP